MMCKSPDVPLHNEKMKSLQLSADCFHTKKLCSRLSSSEFRCFTQIGRFAFLSPPLGT